MEFNELILLRGSIRGYTGEPVSEEDLAYVLEAFRMAPTACNLQPFGLIVIHTEGKKEELSRIYRADWFTQAPIVICACDFPRDAWSRSDGKNYADMDIAIAFDHLILAAADRGLGTCWIGAFDPAAAHEVLNLPKGVEPIFFTPLGHPAVGPRPKKRKEISDIVRYETWE